MQFNATHTVQDRQVIQFNCSRLWTTWDLSICYKDLVKAIKIQNERENHLKNWFFEVFMKKRWNISIKTQMLYFKTNSSFSFSCLCSSEVGLWFCTPKVHGLSLLWAIEVFLLILHHFGGVRGSNPAKAAKYLTFFDMTRHGPATLLLHSHLVLFDMPWV